MRYKRNRSYETTLLARIIYTALSSQSCSSTTIRTHHSKKFSSIGAFDHAYSMVDFPKPQYKNSDLNQQNRAAIIRVYADETGDVTKATVQETTGIKALDEKLVNAVLQAKVKPFMEDDTALAVIGYQVFNLNLTPDDAEACNYSFDSKNWRAQQQQQKCLFNIRLNLSLR
jgi:TonB family protein